MQKVFSLKLSDGTRNQPLMSEVKETKGQLWSISPTFYEQPIYRFLMAKTTNPICKHRTLSYKKAARKI